MKQVLVSQEVYEQLKGFIVDPFDDTLETVISRLMMIAHKARDRWMELHEGDKTDQGLPHTDGLPDIIDDITAEAESPSSDEPRLQCRTIGEPSSL